jgi:NADH-ubiquinone oxidoreductase chain 3
MTSITFFFLFIPLLAFLLLAVNLIFAPHNPYQEKDSTFECGFHSFLGQNRTQFSISFFIFALLFLLFDLEILLIYPYVVSSYTNGIYGLVIMLIFFLALTLGFAFELGKNALKIDSRQLSILFIKEDFSLVIENFILSRILYANTPPNRNEDADIPDDLGGQDPEELDDERLAQEYRLATEMVEEGPGSIDRGTPESNSEDERVNRN